MATAESITSARKAAAAALLEQQLNWQQERQRQVDSWEAKRRAAPASPPGSPSPSSSPEVPRHAPTAPAEGATRLPAAVSAASVGETGSLAAVEAADAAQEEVTKAEADGSEAEAEAAASEAAASEAAAAAAAAEAAKQEAIEREVRARQTPERRAADSALRKSMTAAEPHGLRATLEVVREAARPELVVAAEEELEALEAAGRERDLKLDGAAARAAERHRASYHAAHRRPSSAAPSARAAVAMRRKTAGDAPELPSSASSSAKGQRRWGAARQTVSVARAFGGRASFEAEAEAERVYVGLPAYEPWLGSDYAIHAAQPRLEAFNRHVAERVREHQRRDSQAGGASAGAAAGAGVSLGRQPSMLLSIGGGAPRRGPRRRANDAELGYLDLWDATAAERLHAEYEQWASRRRLNACETRIKSQPPLPLHPTGAARRAAAAEATPASVGLLEQQLAALALKRDPSVVLASAELLGRLALNEPSADLNALLDSCGFGPAAANADADNDDDDDADSEANSPGRSQGRRSPSPAAFVEAKYWRASAEQPRHLSASAPPARRHPSDAGISPASSRSRLARAVRTANAVVALSGRSSSGNLGGGPSTKMSISTSALDTMVTSDSFDLKRGGRRGGS